MAEDEEAELGTEEVSFLIESLFCVLSAPIGFSFLPLGVPFSQLFARRFAEIDGAVLDCAVDMTARKLSEKFAATCHALHQIRRLALWKADSGAGRSFRSFGSWFSGRTGRSATVGAALAKAWTTVRELQPSSTYKCRVLPHSLRLIDSLASIAGEEQRRRVWKRAAVLAYGAKGVIGQKMATRKHVANAIAQLRAEAVGVGVGVEEVAEEDLGVEVEEDDIVAAEDEKEEERPLVSDRNSWFTPPDLVAAAEAVLGGSIGLDPSWHPECHVRPHRSLGWTVAGEFKDALES